MSVGLVEVGNVSVGLAAETGGGGGGPPAVAKSPLQWLFNRKAVMATRGVAITVEFMAWDTSANTPKTGDSANITLRWVKDGTSAALTTTTVTEIDSTNCPGLYKCDLSATETDCKVGMLHGKSATASIYVIPIEIGFVYTPNAAAGANGGLPTVDANNAVKVQSGTGANQISLSSGLVTLAGVTHTGAVIPTVTTVTNQLTAAAIATGVWQDATGSDFTTVGSVGKRVTDYLTGDAYARLGAPAGASLAADVAAVKAETATIVGQTGTTGVVVGSIAANAVTASAIAAGALTATKFAAGAIDAAALATDAANEIRDAVWAKVFSELTVDPGATPAASDAVMLGFMAVRNKRETDSGLGTDKIHNSAGTAILSATISDAAGVFTKAKYA